MHILVSDPSGVGEARRNAADRAAKLGFGPEDCGRVALVATEMATNIAKHAGEGTLAVEPFSDLDGVGMELLAFDKGPGIADPGRAMEDGYSTAGSPGTGLGAIRRQSDSFAFYSRPGNGAAVLARIVDKSRRPVHNHAVIGRISRPYPGEIESGDAWAYHETEDGRTLLVADGSGHGPGAAHAGAAVLGAFSKSASQSGPRLMETLHRALMPTRGAAVALASYRPAERAVHFVGLGNIVASMNDATGTKRMVSNNGTAGQLSPKIKEFVYSCDGLPLMILHSDGLSGKWDLNAYPGLSVAHPSLIAAILFRDFKRGRDDSLAVAVRFSS